MSLESDRVTESPKLLWTPLADAAAVSRAACDRIDAAARKSITERGLFRMVLAGGSTPQKAYHLLAGTEQEWSRWHLYFGDERCLPVDDADRNSVMAQSLTKRVSIPERQVHTIPAELGAELAATVYAGTIENALPFDLVLLGLGEDGHTASLFPDHAHPENQTVVAIHDAPKPPPDRVSLNTNTLGQCRQLLFLVAGREKCNAVRQWLAGEKIPAARITPKGPAEVLIDRAAMPG